MVLRLIPPLLVALATSASAAAGGEGVIAGRVILSGVAPAAKLLVKSSDPVCAKTPSKDESILVGVGGGLANVVVALPAGTRGGGKPFAKAIIDQKGCRYTPRVVLVRRGDPVKIRNSDGTLHNVHAYAGGETVFNEAQVRGGPELVKEAGAEPSSVITLKCDVHPWMEAFLYVTDHFFARVSDAAGRYKIERVPAGPYQLEAWHPVLGKQIVPVLVRAGKTSVVNFNFSEKP
jgi:plastocyanin